MKITRRCIGQSLMLGTMVLMGSSFSVHAAPSNPGSFSHGWASQPPAVNSQLGTMTNSLSPIEAKPQPDSFIEIPSSPKNPGIQNPLLPGQPASQDIPRPFEPADSGFPLTWGKCSAIEVIGPDGECIKP